MALSGNVVLTILDGSGATVQVPASSLQVVIGCAAGGNVGEIVPTRSQSTILSTFVGGPLVQAAGLMVANGGTGLLMRAETNVDGYVEGSERDATQVTGGTAASPVALTIGAGHGLVDGSIVTVAGISGLTGATGTFRVSVVSPTVIELVGSTGGGSWSSGGTVQFEGPIMAGSGTSVPTVSGSDPNDDYFCQLDVIKGGTIGDVGITFTVSLDAGRTKGPTISLGTDTDYTIDGTGIVVAFASGTLVAGDRIRFSTNAPTWNDSGIADTLEAFRVSQYSSLGWGGGTHIVGAASQTSVAAIAGSGDPCLDSLADDYVFTRGIFTARDAARPAAWGGPATAETESEWMSDIIDDFGSLSAKRALVAAGYYNMGTAFKFTAAGAPRLRLPLSYAYAARQVAIPPQRHAGRVREDGRGSGSIKQILLDALNDAKDGFIYHDEELNPALDSIKGGAGRFCSARSRKGLPGMFFSNPILSSPAGSDFDLMPKGMVMDVASGIVVKTGQQFINDDVRTNDNGTIDERDAKVIESKIGGALKNEMVSAGMCTAAKVTVDRDWNVKDTSRVKVGARIRGKAYVLEVDIELGFESTTAADG